MFEVHVSKEVFALLMFGLIVFSLACGALLTLWLWPYPDRPDIQWPAGVRRERDEAERYTAEAAVHERSERLKAQRRSRGTLHPDVIRN